MSTHLVKQFVPIEKSKDIANNIRALLKKFNNRLTLDNRRLCERYLNGELHVLLHFRDGNDVEYAASLQREMRDSPRLQKKAGIVDIRTGPSLKE